MDHSHVTMDQIKVVQQGVWAFGEHLNGQGGPAVGGQRDRSRPAALQHQQGVSASGGTGTDPPLKIYLKPNVSGSQCGNVPASGFGNTSCVHLKMI